MPEKHSTDEFFQDERGDYSMSRLVYFLAFMVAGFIMVKLAMTDKMSEGYLTIFLTTFAAASVLSKAIDNKTFGNLAPPPLQPGQPPAPPPAG